MQRLRTAVFFHHEIIFGQGVDDFSMLVANRGGDVYDFHVDRDVCFFLAAQPGPDQQQSKKISASTTRATSPVSLSLFKICSFLLRKIPCMQAGAAGIIRLRLEFAL